MKTLFGRLVALVPIALFLGGCRATATQTVVMDIGQQAVLTELAKAPHLKGPVLYGGSVALSANYGVSLTRASEGLRAGDSPALGSVVATHTWDARATIGIGANGNRFGRGWELGFNFGMASVDFADPLAADVQISSFKDFYFRAGMGLRGPIYSKKRFSSGFILELDLAHLPYSAEVARFTKFSERGEEKGVNLGKGLPIWIPGYDVNESIEYEELVNLDGTYFFPIWRSALFIMYEPSKRISVSGGLSVQRIPTVKGVDIISYECVSYGQFFGGDSADTCREDHDDFPVVGAAMAGTAYVGLHYSLSKMVITLRGQAHTALDNDDAYVAPFSADLEASYRF